MKIKHDVKHNIFTKEEYETMVFLWHKFLQHVYINLLFTVQSSGCNITLLKMRNFIGILPLRSALHALGDFLC